MDCGPSPLAVAIARLLAFPVGLRAFRALRERRGTCCAPEQQHEPLPGDDVPSPHGPPVFLSGCSRGGTSILAHLLSHHPDLHSVGRGRYHEARWVWEQRFHDGSHHRWAVEPWLSAMRKTAADGTPELLTFFRQVYANACGSKRMLEKTPSNAVRLPFIDRLYPDCYVVHIIRDGRHTAASLMARRVRLCYAAQQWVGAHSIALSDIERIGPARAAVVRYEDLLQSPVDTLVGLCSHCDLDAGQRARQALAAAVGCHLQRPLDRWSRLPARKRSRILEIVGGLQTRLGYPIEE